MTKIRDLIEKIWWVIPLIIVAFVGVPLLLTFVKLVRYAQPINYSFFGDYARNISLVMDPVACGYYGIIIIIFSIGLMGFGYYLVETKSSLLLRIIVLTILGMIGFFVGLIIAPWNFLPY